jgi:4'-phosphopantetheinyl transferase
MSRPWTAWIDTRHVDLHRSYATLSEDERERAQRFRFAHHRKRWVAARGWLRQRLGEILKEDPGTLVFRYNEYGKPYLEGARLVFNLSHSGNLAMLAWSLDSEESAAVGVDVEEHLDAFAWHDVAQHAFSLDEQRGLAGLPSEEQRRHFYEIWTRKEAYVKALGCGVGTGTSKFTVWPENALTGGWKVEAIPAPAGYSAAMAWREAGDR